LAFSSFSRGAKSDLRFVFLDFEAFFSKDYTLRKLDPASYILDERFDAHCVGFVEGFTDAPELVMAEDIPDLLEGLGTDVAVVTHNALFDACILSWRYGYIPRLLIDTLALSRTLLRRHLRSLALRNVAKFLMLEAPEDEKRAVMKAEGYTVADLVATGMWEQYAHDCLVDTALCRAIFLHLAPLLPPEEFILHDMILRCAVEPAFKADQTLLQQNIEEVQQRKDELFFRAMCAGLRDKSQLMSNQEFATLLSELDVEPPKKISKTTNRLTFAFAKSDPDFLALLEHDDPRVVALVEARLAFKTTIEETRSKRMLDLANLTVPGKGSGWMPIPLKVGAAITHRLGGDWQLNPQNWGRRSLIRKAVLAPPGHKVVTGDSEQIEARMNAWFCGQWDLVRRFASGEDVYAWFASEEIYHCPVTKETEPAKRFVGKTGMLQLGYQSGPQKLKDMVWLQSRATEPEPIVLTFYEADGIVFAYRKRMDRISGMWETLRDMIREMAHLPSTVSIPFGTDDVIRIGFDKVTGPNGLCLYYDELRYDRDANGWTYFYGGVRYKLYGGKWLENIIQFLARIATMQAAIRLRKPLAEYGVRLNHTSHDELIYVVPDRHVDVVKSLIRSEMSLSPKWAPGLPLSCSIGVGQSYGEAK
jgi:DNA polymerase